MQLRTQVSPAPAIGGADLGGTKPGTTAALSVLTFWCVTGWQRGVYRRAGSRRRTRQCREATALERNGCRPPRHSPQPVLRINPQIKRTRFGGKRRCESRRLRTFSLTDVIEARTASPKVDRAFRTAKCSPPRSGEGCCPAPFRRGSAGKFFRPSRWAEGDINIHPSRSIASSRNGWASRSHPWRGWSDGPPAHASPSQRRLCALAIFVRHPTRSAPSPRLCAARNWLPQLRERGRVSGNLALEFTSRTTK